MDQPNKPNNLSDMTPPQKPDDLTFSVMPQEGKGFAGGVPSAPRFNPPPSSTNNEQADTGGRVAWSRKWIYIAVGIIVLLALGKLAFYMLGSGGSEPATQNPTTQLPKQWLSKYFINDPCEPVTCADNVDPDNDGLSNYNEFKNNTNPLSPDSDSDGLADGDEVNVYKTDPTLKYTDRREIVASSDWTDGFQIKNGFDPLTPALKLNDVRLAQIAADTAKYQLHEPTLSTTSSANPPATAALRTHTSTKYSLEFKYPPTAYIIDRSLSKAESKFQFDIHYDSSTAADPARLVISNELDTRTGIKLNEVSNFLIGNSDDNGENYIHFKLGNSDVYANCINKTKDPNVFNFCNQVLATFRFVQ